MRAVVLAGGKGTRLYPYSTIVPKPLMPVGEKAILELLIQQLESFGVTRITISLGHLAHLIRAVLDNGTRFKALIDYSVEDSPLGTSGPLSLIPDLDDTFLVTNGDILSNIGLDKLVAYHRESGAVVTIATHRRQMQIDYGVIHSSSQRVVKYDEKPTIDYEVSMGIYICEPHILDFIPPSTYLDFPDLVHKLLKSGEPVATYPFDGIWYDLGRVDDFQNVQEQIDELAKEIPFLRP
jgi:NDP-sugar pyrophosphorylase family protein